MAKKINFLICSSNAAGNKVFGANRSNSTARDDNYTFRTYTCADVDEFNSHMSFSVPRANGALWGMIEVLDTETGERRQATAADFDAPVWVIGVDLAKNGYGTITELTEPISTSSTAEAPAPEPIPDPSPEAEGAVSSEPAELQSAVEPAREPLASPNDSAEEAVSLPETPVIEETPAEAIPSTDNLADRIAEAVATEAKQYVVLADELGVTVEAVRLAANDGTGGRFSTRGGWVKLIVK